MSALQRDHLRTIITITSFMVALLLIAAPQAISQPCAVSPSAGGVTVLPNVLIILDNSGSMLQAAYPTAYSTSTTYYGLFDPTKDYTYDSTNNYFEEDTSGSWSGNFLNWATIIKWDVAVYVLTGQRYVDVGSDRFLVANPDNRYYDDSFTTNHWYTDTAGVTPYDGDGTSRRYRGVPFYYADNYDITITDNQWSYLEVYMSGSQSFFYLRLKVDSSYTPTGLLDNLLEKVRLGLMHFNSQEGGYIRRYVNDLDSTQLSNLLADLYRPLVEQPSYFTDYISHTWTPLAETLYEATRYFGQAAQYYSSGDYSLANTSYPERDPFYYADEGDKLWCPKNYVILLTDGLSTQDLNIPTELQDYYDDELSCTPDPNPCGCDLDYTCAGSNFDSNGSAYLDDIAYYAYTTDLRPSDLEGDQHITLHTVYLFGTTGEADVLLDKAAQRGGGEYYRAENASEIATALEDIFVVITERAAAAASTAITSEPVSGTDLIYIPYYKNPQEAQWLGNIRAFALDDDGNIINSSGGVAEDTDDDDVLDAPVWDATVELEDMNRANREIFTYISGSKVDFDTTNAATVGPYFDVDLDNDTTEDEVGTDQEVNALISYIRGTDAPSGFSDLRERDPYYLGDIMHASPAFVGKPSTRYDLTYGDLTYWTFYWNNKDRTPVLYAPANDGMLHCFDATLGQEKWAYIPFNLLPHLKWLTDPDYCHCYYVDLTADVWDIEVSGEWKSVLVGGMRLGGTPDVVDTDDDGTDDETLRSALFALDVTNPDPTVVTRLWEINNEEFGYTTSKPIPVRVEEGGTTKWFLVFGSGPKTRDGAGGDTSDGYSVTDASIFVLDVETGGISTIGVGAWGTGNFFGSPVAIDYDLDYEVDFIYIGDAKGNLWRIKTLNSITPANWSIDVNSDDEANPEPLLSLGTDQPILIKPSVSKDEQGRVWVFFGTGRYFCANDNEYCGEGNVCPDGTSGSCVDATETDRSKYMAVGVYDRHRDSGTSSFVLQDSTLDFDTDPSVLDHRVIMQGTIVSTGETGYYIVDSATGESDTDVSTNGWYFHLLEEGERCLGDFTIDQGAIYFISFTPDVSDPCARGGLSNLYGVYYTSGTSTTDALFGDDVVSDGTNTYSPAIVRLDKGFAGGSPKIKDTNLYLPLPDEPIPINPPDTGPSTGITSWREVLQ